MQEILKELSSVDTISCDICVFCKNVVDGRIYSEAGLREYQNSGTCEICFDNLSKE